MLKKQAGILCLCFCIFGFQVIHANQPKQTIQSAQEFLSLTLTNVDFRPGELKKIFNEITASNNDRSNIYSYGKILDIKPHQRCKSNLTYSSDGLTVRITHKNQNLDLPLTTFRPDLAIVTKSGGIDWSKLSYVERNGAIVKILLDQDKEYSEISLNNDDMATRVAFAMKFLQHHCDHAAATGF